MLRWCSNCSLLYTWLMPAVRMGSGAVEQEDVAQACLPCRLATTIKELAEEHEEPLDDDAFFAELDKRLERSQGAYGSGQRREASERAEPSAAPPAPQMRGEALREAEREPRHARCAQRGIL